eukprot:TRINITY_DN5897_c0_g1_i2.p1 TRINITY_DN5897_c0_g1~~TRINITY_DN5897_c0_g1_i2.p1  ORF type:complete len:299 (-),score=84.95 TRINITY_DN5897_c0_g1_i2:8-817(-)
MSNHQSPSLFEQALALEWNDNAKAHQLMQEAYEGGDKRAAAMLAKHFMNALGCKVDYKACWKYASEAVSVLNDPYGHFLLGICLQNQYDVESDQEAAFQHFQAGCEAEKVHPLCEWAMGRALVAGRGVNVDKERGDALLQSSIPKLQEWSEDGDAVTKSIVGYCMQIGSVVEKDEQKAYELFLAAAEAGNVNSFLNVGGCLEKGIGVQADPDNAIQWYEKGVALDQYYCVLQLAKQLVGVDDEKADELLAWLVERNWQRAIEFKKEGKE